MLLDPGSGDGAAILSAGPRGPCQEAEPQVALQVEPPRSPYTLQSSSDNLHHTLHPTLYTPHPTPYTLHPTPYTSLSLSRSLYPSLSHTPRNCSRTSSRTPTAQVSLSLARALSLSRSVSLSHTTRALPRNCSRTPSRIRTAQVSLSRSRARSLALSLSLSLCLSLTHHAGLAKKLQPHSQSHSNRPGLSLYPFT